VGQFVEEVSFIILLVQLGLAGFSIVSRVSKVRVWFSFSNKVGIGLPDVE